MDYKAFLALTLPLSLGIVAFGSAIALGKAVAAKILINMAAGCAFIEAITIYVLVFAFMLGKF
jgi:F0F1-type ATP synthase membrane subunit c/vacuolar-type H+-ATPase subunit K